MAGSAEPCRLWFTTLAISFVMLNFGLTLTLVCGTPERQKSKGATPRSTEAASLEAHVLTILVVVGGGGGGAGFVRRGP